MFVKNLKDKQFNAVDTMKQVLELIYDMVQCCDKEDKIPRVLSDTCNLLLMCGESRNIREQYGIADEKEDEMNDSWDVCFFPSYIDADLTAIPAKQFELPHKRKVAIPRIIHNENDGMQLIRVMPYYCFVLNNAHLKDMIVLIMFRCPSKFITRVEDCKWMGITENSCLCIVSHYTNQDAVQACGNEYTEGYGAQWIWICNDNMYYKPQIRDIRSHSTVISVPKKSSLVLYRCNFAWTLRIVNDY